MGLENPLHDDSFQWHLEMFFFLQQRQWLNQKLDMYLYIVCLVLENTHGIKTMMQCLIHGTCLIQSKL